MTLEEKLKWAGTYFLLVGVTLNILNNPDLQQYVYPWNLAVNLTGCSLLFFSALLQGDRPYLLLNGVLGVGYSLGILNAFYPLSDMIDVLIALWTHMAHADIHFMELTGLTLY
jgi:hypothetical protein